MLWICLHFPDLPLRVFSRGVARQRPTVVSSNDHRPDVVVGNEAAGKLGIVPGFSIAAALALDPELSIHPRDERAEAAALSGIALWAGQFTSTISIEPPAGVLLEVSASLGYFHGLGPLLDRIADGLSEIGFPGIVAVAPAAAAASMLARSGQASTIVRSADFERAVANLPVRLLANAQPALDTLAGIGVRTIGELLALPRDGVARRFGQALRDEIDRARGCLPDPRPLFIAPERYHGQLELPSPVEATEALLFAVRRLVIELAGFLQSRGAGVTRLRCDLLHPDADPTSILIGLAPTRQSEHILNVLRERFARLELPDRVEALRLVSEEIAPLQAKEGDFFPVIARDGEAGVQLFERLRARLGEDAVRRVALHADHRPELAGSYRTDAPAGRDRLPADAPLRPLWLLPEPRPLPADRVQAALCLSSGPERIETGWWEGNDCSRDYFVGRNEEGEQLWLFRDRGGQWFVHGIFA